CVRRDAGRDRCADSWQIGRASRLQLRGAMTVRDLLLAPSARWLLAGGGALAVLAAVTFTRDDARPVEAPTISIEAREPAVAVQEVALEDEVEEPEPADPLDSIQS